MYIKYTHISIMVNNISQRGRKKSLYYSVFMYTNDLRRNPLRNLATGKPVIQCYINFDQFRPQGMRLDVAKTKGNTSVRVLQGECTVVSSFACCCVS